jgi:hypothetical protein
MENTGVFSVGLLLAAILALIGWGDVTGRIPPQYGGNRLSGKGFLLSSLLVLVSLFALGAGWRDITGASFLAALAVLVVSALLRGRSKRKRKKRGA